MAEQRVKNVVEPILMNNSSSNEMIQNNVTLTNYNNFKIFLEDSARNNDANMDTRHDVIVSKVNGHVTGHFNDVSKQILYIYYYIYIYIYIYINLQMKTILRLFHKCLSSARIEY